LENYEEVVTVEKYLHVVRVIKDDELAKDSKDASKKSQEIGCKGRDKEATDIETLTRLVNSLSIEMSKLKQCKMHKFASSHRPRQRHVSSTSSNK